MRLEGPGTTPIDVVAHAPIVFAGEAMLDCTLIDGPVRDFNLMVRRAVAEGAVQVVRGEARRLSAADACVCHAVTGACEVTLVDGRRQMLATGHSLVVTGPDALAPGGLRIVAESASALAVVALVRNR